MVDEHVPGGVVVPDEEGGSKKDEMTKGIIEGLKARIKLTEERPPSDAPGWSAHDLELARKELAAYEAEKNQPE